MIFYQPLQKPCNASLMAYGPYPFFCFLCVWWLWLGSSACSFQGHAIVVMSARADEWIAIEQIRPLLGARSPPYTAFPQLSWRGAHEGGMAMLGNWLDHESYVKFITKKAGEFETIHEGGHFHLWRDVDGRILLNQMLFFNLDAFYPILATLYSARGRPANYQDRILRSLALFVATQGGNHLGRFKGIDQWITSVVPGDPFLLALCGSATPDEYPDLGNHYDLIHRLWLGDRSRYEQVARYNAGQNWRGRFKIGNDNKVIDTEFSVADMIGHLSAGEQLSANHEMLYQQMLGLMAVVPSINCGLIPEVCCGSMDSTAYYEHANRYGKCECGIDRIRCPHKKECGVICHFSSPDGRVGFDSGEEHSFFGEHLHAVTVHSYEHQADVPVCFMLADAQRHDSVVFPVLYQEMSANIPAFHMDYFAGDSAYDHVPIYDFLLSEGTIPVIALNTKATSYKELPKGFSISAAGNPVCPAQKQMVFVGNDEKKQCWTYACPMKLGEQDPCGHCGKCPYHPGKVESLRINPKDSSRFFTVIPRDSTEFAGIMKGRSASERFNKRFLHDYGLSDILMRNADHRSFLVALACIFVHIDAWIKMELLPPMVSLEDYHFLTGKQLDPDEAKQLDCTASPLLIKELMSNNRKRKEALALRQKQVETAQAYWDVVHEAEMRGWECPVKKAERLEQAGEHPVLGPAWNQLPFPLLELLSYECHSVKCWEVPYMASLPADLVIDHSGNAYTEEELPGRLKGFKDVTPGNHHRKQNGFEEVCENVWRRPVISPFTTSTASPPLIVGVEIRKSPSEEADTELGNAYEYIPPQLYGVERGEESYGRVWQPKGAQMIQAEAASGDGITSTHECTDIRGDEKPLRAVTVSEGRNPKLCNLPAPGRTRAKRYLRNPRDSAEQKSA